MGTCLKAKSHLPRGKKSFELAQKLVRLGANQIKNSLIKYCPYLQRYKINGRNASTWLKIFDIFME